MANSLEGVDIGNENPFWPRRQGLQTVLRTDVGMLKGLGMPANFYDSC